MKTFLCWGISKLEGLAALLVCFTMGILAANETRILHEEQLNVNGWILLIPHWLEPPFRLSLQQSMQSKTLMK